MGAASVAKAFTEEKHRTEWNVWGFPRVCPVTRQSLVRETVAEISELANRLALRALPWDSLLFVWKGLRDSLSKLEPLLWEGDARPFAHMCRFLSDVLRFNRPEDFQRTVVQTLAEILASACNKNTNLTESEAVRLRQMALKNDLLNVPALDLFDE